MEASEVLTYRQISADPVAWHALRREGVTASEIASVLGISPWMSPFALWHRKRGLLGEQADDRRMSLGRHLEAYVADLFAERQLGYRVLETGLWRNSTRPWQLATPDRLLLDDAIPLECKTDSVADERWGADGTDEIPVYYRAQLMWQMDTLGADEGFLACFFLLNQELRVYYLKREEDECQVMRAAAGEFLAMGQPPPVDWTDSSRAALRELYPLADEEAQVKVPRMLRRSYEAACQRYAVAEKRKKEMENRLRLVMGGASRAADATTGDVFAKRTVYNRAGYTVKPTVIDRLTPVKGKRNGRENH